MTNKIIWLVTPLNIVLVAMIPLALIYFFDKYDEELSGKLKIKKLNIIIISMIAILYNIASIIFLRDNLSNLINTSLLTGYLIFSSYTDLRTKLLYTSVSLTVLFIEVAWLLLDYKEVKLNEYSWVTAVVIVVLAVMAIPRWIGFGDVIIYAIVATYLTHYRMLPTFSLLMNILFANIMFTVVTIIIKIVKHDKEKHQPLTLFIAISTVLCCLIGV